MRIGSKYGMAKPRGRKVKVCSGCSTENPVDRADCAACGKLRFEPEWVKAHRRITRQFSVQITTTNPAYGDVAQRLTLSKWWPGGRSTFHLPNAGQWAQVVEVVQTQLGPLLGWKTVDKLVDSAIKKGAESGHGKQDIAKLARDYPEFLSELIAALEPQNLSKQDFGNVTEVFSQIADILTKANAGFRDAYLSVLKRLPKQRQRALEDLAFLLDGWSLNVITNVAQQVQSRLETIDLFERQIQDARTFEILGDTSIHRILERAMWLVDEKYWLLHSNKALRTQIGQHMSKTDKVRYGGKRPDFVCGSVGDTLIILELKRPGHTLNVDDMNQLETYLSVAKKYFTAKSFRGYLVGSTIDEELERRLEFRRGTQILFYANIIDSTKKRYEEFLKTVD